MAEPTIILSCSDKDSAEHRDFESALVEQLRTSGTPRVLMVPSIYWLTASSSAVDAIRKIDGPLVVAAWLYPRASFWILRYHGIRGRMGDGNGTIRRAGRGDERDIVCLNLEDYSSPEACARALLDTVGVGDNIPGETTVEPVPGDIPARWYPVLDRSACVNCRQCYDFCLFGVYELDAEGQVTVANPDACKTGCPACARTCPEGAILFPHCDSDLRIAGAEEAECCEPPSPETPSPSVSDELDSLIDELDKRDV